MKRIGELIREARLRQGLSQESLASLLGFRNFTSISKVEHGRATLSPKRISLASKILAVPVDDLVQALLREQEIKIKRKGNL